MVIFSTYNIIYLILLPLFVQLIQSAPNPLDELTINVNIGGTDPDTPVHCGVKNEGTQNTGRIVGGNETEINEYPWMVYIQLRGHKWCGGSVIADKWILTAAHCMQSYDILKKLDLVLGEHDLTTTAETQITKHVKPNLLIMHPDYDHRMAMNDIALLRIPPIDLKTYTPVCLPANGAGYYTGQNAWTYGWGDIQQGGASSDKLLEVEIPVISDQKAKEIFLSSDLPLNLTDAQLEAAAPVMVFAFEEGKDSCQGDSGGPLSYANPANKGRHEQIGIVSWGFGCAAGLPGGYTEVSALRPWIDDQIARNGGGTVGEA